MRFFISSTYEDLKEVRRVAINMLKSLTEKKTGSISAMEDFPASQNSSRIFCVEQVEKADIMIGIYGYRFGSKNEDGRSMTELEFDEATKREIPILVFVAEGAECTEDIDQKHFINQKVSKVDGVWARFNPKDLDGFATVLNNTLKKHLDGFNGYSYHSIWDDIVDLKNQISKDDGIPRLIPYGENEEEKAFNDIIESTYFFLRLLKRMSETNDCIYDLAYVYNLSDGSQNGEYEQRIKNEEYRTLEMVKERSNLICGNWECINIGSPNNISAILMAVNYLKLCYVQKKLLTESWTEDLRQEMLTVKNYYMQLAGKEHNILAD